MRHFEYMSRRTKLWFVSRHIFSAPSPAAPGPLTSTKPTHLRAAAERGFAGAVGTSAPIACAGPREQLDFVVQLAGCSVNATSAKLSDPAPVEAFRGRAIKHDVAPPA